ncbi:MAG: YfdX family protein [Zymomonas mobilis subsp. pomaceae]|uniref:YfdX protein n=1 Tax=Zymomonas mobilis subsp. pomaceae (strain ATCC 29192 / DSM 22645 / JCM 10191 / CCUG 17912 / NBRC 13757 / NCIMB 11200 / NRRL B-4491 / Barker I) TaxID=579138 RepID=F8EVW4_ZYMMT|nr:YfdX family protein [Zymomonas mobilis]AEI37441.1 conserved hypothetical protein [Zymomonas mobilis subsp. pomaceae ATCC 29192]MDX5948808.1 YfdX family protein [Zymomonas mobilis subsp. pomaceae]GEB88616.1 hypothetical protein ZMO02_02530 [Zymomonas mobilis subsp. pomaceae]
MRLFMSLTALAVLATTPSLASPASSIHTKWEEHKADRALDHLSIDGQYAMVDILQAKHILDSGQTTAALPMLRSATKRLTAAGSARKKFIAAENDLHPAPQHPLSASHSPAASPVTWVPVGGEFFIGETLAPEKQQAVTTANNQLKAGKNQQAVQTMRVIGEETDFVVALAPLDQTEKAVSQATLLAKGKQAQKASQALDQVIDSLVFVSDDDVEKALPTSNHKPATRTHKAG